MERQMFIKTATKLNIAKFACYMVMALGFFANGIVNRQSDIINKAYGLDKKDDATETIIESANIKGEN